MLASRSIRISSQRITAPTSLRLPYSPVPDLWIREYHGDPGPSSSLHLKSRKKQLRETVSGDRKGGSLKDLAALDDLMNADSRRPFRARDETRSNMREPSFRPQSTYGQSNTQLPRTWAPAAPTDPYATAFNLQRWIKFHPSPMSEHDVDKAYEMVVDARQEAVNAPVWNILLALLGREGKLDRMWKAFNEVGQWPTSTSSRGKPTLERHGKPISGVQY
jgi:pentatricopeptide repeat protein